MKKYLILLPFMLAGCATILGKRSATEDEQAVILAKRAAEEAELKNAERVLEKGRFKEAQILFKDFYGRHQQSSFYQAARLGEAEALDGMEEYQQAASLYRDVYLRTIQGQPEIAALALYKMSFTYEALGDDEKTIAALLDARKLSEHLPLEVAEAEIPARLAAIYGRQGREQETVDYLSQADKGIAKVLQEQRPQLQPGWLAKTYFQMGLVSTNQISEENFSEFAQGQRWIQVYLFKAMKQNDETWSQRAQEELQNVYRNLFTLVESSQNRDVQSRLGGDLLDLMDQAELYKPILGQKETTYEKNFFSYLAEVRKKLDNVLYGSGETMSLTEESQRLNSIKRAGRVKPDSLLPEEQKSPIPLPPKVVPEEDPNL
ncbi:hypothetical protein AZI85_01925 [Bdellovibrio bacteriovorus]|uniref:Uncharacterized protein n=1 Tax=Bdellovibrio bacteriovorus TaxID=959 RepID=A0A150WWA6_BDEBC|nr:hypothetical protein [Bdellovibrio bacteriovorus]KYG70714.1 hypothetical protein AZI85_01925 [Bdellovibrio bacteriovorus]